VVSLITQNRYYSNLAQATFIANTGGLGISTAALQVTANENWPTQFPFAVWLEPNTNNAEVALVTAGSGTAINPYSIVRGYDNTVPFAHAAGAVVTPGVIELDLADPQNHLNLTGSASGAHGLPASAWLGGQLQLIDTVTVLTPQPAVTFPSVAFATIPSTINHLFVVIQALSSSLSVNNDLLTVQYNGYSGSFYADQYLLNANGTNSTNNFASNSASSGMSNNWHINASQAVCGILLTTNAGTASTGHCEITFPNYRNSAIVSPKGHNFSFGGSSNTLPYTISGNGTGSCAQVTAPISSLTFQTALGNNFTANSTFQLYGF
jgi:hypothetical protein